MKLLLGRSHLPDGLPEGHHDRELRADAALVADLAGSFTSGLAAAFREKLTHTRGKPPLRMTAPIPNGLGPMVPTVLSKYALLSELRAYETLHSMGRLVGTIGVGFDFVNSGISYANGNKLQSGLDALSGGLGVLMVARPETVPVALPTLGLVKGAKPYANALGFMGCVNGWQSQSLAY